MAPPVQPVALTCRHAIFRSDTTDLHKPRDMSRPVVTLLALYALPNVWAFGFRAHGYRPHLAKRTGQFLRSNKKEGGLFRRKGNRDVGPYLDKESFLHSSGFFGDGFMPNIPASVVRKREQASGKHKQKAQSVKMGFPKMMLNSLMQRLNLPNMRQLLKGKKKSKPPPNEAVKGSDEYPYPFHSIPSSALPPKNVKKPPPKPPQKVPIGILTPEFDRPLPLFVKSPHN